MWGGLLPTPIDISSKPPPPPRHISRLFNDDSKRYAKFHREIDLTGHGSLLVDYSKNRLTEEKFELLLKLAQEEDVEGMRGKMFSGVPINFTENR